MPEKSPAFAPRYSWRPDAVRLVVRAHAVEEAVDVELGEEHVVEPPDVLERVARVVEERLGDGVRDAERRDARQCVRGALVREDPARVVVEEEELVGKRREALLASVAREVVRREVARREPRDDADRRADVEPERGRLLVRRPLLASRVRQLVAAERRHVQAEIAEDVEGLVEPLVGVALVRERADEDASLLEDPLLEVVADTFDVRAVRPARSTAPRAPC